ncbi:MAG: glycosyltransferase family 2 protein [Chlorobi bacterium]|nr:glycosyltransferase family 2 protein [Chlorobiota bacterium]
MISVVIPVYNEEELIDELIERVARTLKSIGEDFEIICIDDGSKDLTVKKLLEKKNQHNRLKIISLSRNFGHQAAITAGLEYAKGDFVAILDGDLQDPPEIIPEMYKKLKNEEYDIAIGYRKERNEKNIKRKLMTRVFHYFFSRISDLDDIEHTGHFSMMNRKALTALLSMKERTRYLPGLRSFIGFRLAKIEYVRQPRSAGESKMRFNQLIRLAADALFAFSRIPVRILLYLGLAGVIIFLIAGIYVIVSKVMGWAPTGWSSTLISIYFLGSVQLTFMGILGEYLFRIYKESQNRPLYFVKEIFE